MTFFFVIITERKEKHSKLVKMVEVIARIQGKRDFNEIKGHIWELLFIQDSCKVPYYGQLAKNKKTERNIINLKCVSTIRNLVSKGGETIRQQITADEPDVLLCDIRRCHVPEQDAGRHFGHSVG